ncbi:uncharacterized protein C1orf131 homolog isoform X2 [Dendropsophus ebraccatus]|uniref:uncharacterized protein C1orf131 homolog isoform X2 n=1 Tax=Dendropsophus ebraccatus TaxID=150705 RepID=UPI0038313D4A
MADGGDARHQLESVLSNLYDFGDDFVTHEDDVPECGESVTLTEEKEADKVNGRGEDCRPVTSSKRGKKTISMFFDSIRNELSGQAEKPAVSGHPGSEPSSAKVVTFVSRKDKNQSKDKNIRDVSTEKNNKTEADGGQEFNFEKARLEVHKFGITGYKKDIQRKFEQERAIMLGAKPPKREYVNYKLYQKQRKEKEQVQQDKTVTENNLEPVKKKRKQGKNDRPRKTKGSRTAPSGQVGRFRDGALILSGKDIEKIKKSKIIK